MKMEEMKEMFSLKIEHDLDFLVVFLRDVREEWSKCFQMTSKIANN